MYANRYFVRPGSRVPAFVAGYGPSSQIPSSPEGNAGSWQPAVDVVEEAERFVIFADLPGVDPASIELSVDRQVLSLRGERHGEPLPEGSQLSRSECARGAFERRFVLPESADTAAVVATSRHGVLQLSIPKKAQAAPRRIEINAAH